MKTIFYIQIFVVLFYCLSVGEASAEEEQQETLPPNTTVVHVSGKSRSGRKYLIFGTEYEVDHRTAFTTCLENGWRLLRIDNEIKQAEVEQRVLNDPNLQTNIWLDGEYWYDNWYLSDGAVLQYRNFGPTYSEEYLPTPSCMTAVPSVIPGTPIYLRNKWALETSCTNRFYQFVCEK